MKKLRREFVVAVFLSVTLVFVLSIAVTSLWMVRSNNHSADIITKILVKNKGDFPVVDRNGTPEEKELIDLYHLTEESPYRYRYFVVFLKNGEVNDLDFSHIVSVDVDYATEATKRCCITAAIPASTTTTATAFPRTNPWWFFSTSAWRSLRKKRC